MNLYLIGLTGNIACGKSTVIAQLRELGAQVIDADQVTRLLQEPGQTVYQQIVAAFGEGILSVPGGAINRAALGAIVFSDPAALLRLEQIVHPAVHQHIWGWLDGIGGQGSGIRDQGSGVGDQAPDPLPVAVIDAIKLLESGWKTHCDAIWVVTCTPAQQLTRLMVRNELSEQEARRRIDAQPPQAEKIAQATVVIDNSGALEATKAQVVEAWQKISHTNKGTKEQDH